MNIVVENYLQEYPKYRQELMRSLKYFRNYFKEIEFLEVNRMNVYNLNEDCFRNYLMRVVKSDSGKNRILFQLSKFYNYLIMLKKSTDDNFDYINPFDYKFDKFKLNKINSTYREVIPVEVIMKMKDVIRDEVYKVEDPSVLILLYTLMSIPIRGKQAQLLESGLCDELLYDFKMKTMIKNIGGIRGRKEGFVQVRDYNGWGLKKECLWITTNKNMNQGYELNYVSGDLLELVEYQVNFIMSKYGNDGVVYLFRDHESFISRNKIIKVWNWLCKVVEAECGFKMFNGRRNLFGLHNLRVSLISHWLDQGIDLKIVSKNIVAHSSESMTLYYYRSDKIKSRLKEAEGCVPELMNGMKLLKGGLE